MIVTDERQVVASKLLMHVMASGFYLLEVQTREKTIRIRDKNLAGLKTVALESGEGLRVSLYQ